ncbi:hypothetical protein CEXT_673251 [Caerostris extrusa]|uniref:Uncharacterized protein n=1 Tax=Caerostris extrusa TaxID=172846 RepID=A0AAV4Y8C2_CAEEX|nr:hypothetical protein CEXT_673251 [Caerostris extrusa]
MGVIFNSHSPGSCSSEIGQEKEPETSGGGTVLFSLFFATGTLMDANKGQLGTCLVASTNLSSGCCLPDTLPPQLSDAEVKGKNNDRRIGT